MNLRLYSKSIWKHVLYKYEEVIGSRETSFNELLNNY